MLSQPIKNLSKSLPFILPLLVFLGWALIAEGMMKLASGSEVMRTVLVLLGVFPLLLIFRVLKKSALKFNIPIPPTGNLRSLAIGLAIGLIVSLACLLVYQKLNGLTIHPDKFEWSYLKTFWFSLAPASLEESIFRSGFVHFPLYFWGPVAAQLFGSLPFGILHIVGIFFGQTFDLSQCLGICAGGWLLTLVFLRWGFLAAFAVHWLWNSLESIFIRLWDIPLGGAVTQFEGAWSTTLILLSICIVASLAFRKRPL